MGRAPSPVREFTLSRENVRGYLFSVCIYVYILTQIMYTITVLRFLCCRGTRSLPPRDVMSPLHPAAGRPACWGLLSPEGQFAVLR